MVQEARIDRLMKLVPFAGTVLYSCFIFILCHHLHATGRVRSQENRVMLSLGVEFFRARNDQYETLHEYYVIDKEFSWRMLDFLLISFSDLFGQGTKDPRTWLTSCEKNRARENEHLEDSPGFESRRWLRIPLISQCSLFFLEHWYLLNVIKPALTLLVWFDSRSKDGLIIPVIYFS